MTIISKRSSDPNRVPKIAIYWSWGLLVAVIFQFWATAVYVLSVRKPSFMLSLLLDLFSLIRCLYLVLHPISLNFCQTSACFKSFTASQLHRIVQAVARQTHIGVVVWMLRATPAVSAMPQYCMSEKTESTGLLILFCKADRQGFFQPSHSGHQCVMPNRLENI